MVGNIKDCIPVKTPKRTIISTSSHVEFKMVTMLIRPRDHSNPECLLPRHVPSAEADLSTYVRAYNTTTELFHNSPHQYFTFRMNSMPKPCLERMCGWQEMYEKIGCLSAVYLAGRGSHFHHLHFESNPVCLDLPSGSSRCFCCMALGTFRTPPNVTGFGKIDLQTIWQTCTRTSITQPEGLLYVYKRQ